LLRDVSNWVLKKNLKIICYPHYLLASPRNIGVHTSTMEYASTASISIVMTMPFPIMPFEKRFLKKWFSPQISSKTPSPQEMEHRKKRKKYSKSLLK
jgi:hypothetical protein